MSSDPVRSSLLPFVLVAFLPTAALAAAPGDATTTVSTETTPATTTTTVETVEVVEHDDDDDDDDDDDHHHHHHDGGSTWFGLGFGTVATPLAPGGHVDAGRRVTSNPFQACLDPGRARYCSAMRGFDVRVQMYRAKDAWTYPLVIGYFRTGYQAGRAQFAAKDGETRQPGEATSLAYQSVPLFFGGSIYAFRKFPVRPYAGMGAGFDIVRLAYRRHEQRALLDASARIGFELHAGIEARISNVVAVSAEVTQLWSARRKLAGVPDFSNEGLTVMAGVTISIPTRKDLRRRHRHVEHRTTVRTPAPAPVAAPAPAKAPPLAEQPVIAPVAPAAPAAPAAPVAPAEPTPAPTEAVAAPTIEAAPSAAAPLTAPPS